MTFRRIALIVGVIGAGLAAAAVVTVRSNGFSARTEPTVVEKVLARTARRWATPRAARQATNPIAFSEEVWAEGRAHFADHCASCHANDGSGETEIGKNLYPRAPDMRLEETQALSDGELYWIITNGVRLTGMPAWGSGGPDDPDTWKLVHFVRRLKDMTPEHLRDMQALNPKTLEELKEEQDDKRFLAGEDIHNHETNH